MVNIPSACNLTTEVSYQHIQAESRFDDGKCGYSECVGSVLGRNFATLPIVKSEKTPPSDHNQL